MSDNPNDPRQWQDEPAMGEPDMDEPTLEEPTADELDDPELNAAEAEADDVDTELDAGVDPDSAAGPTIEPGADGPEGTGIEGADNALVEAEGVEDELNAPDLPGEFSTDTSPAAEMGNRPGDEMVSEDEDEAEVAELAGDDLDVDALADDGVEEVALIDGMPEVIDDSYNED
ncbi:hypothetical protein GCM10009689_03200 [Brevibacterium antiquum]|uniref:hypothetical protein n=1 Tax=Brevibacterium antiquum TaxID=234835 RepID=UPI0018DFDAA4|nr:hypothetical protein [Brevibacterium antiquum]